jgi:hypothetical protein
MTQFFISLSSDILTVFLFFQGYMYRKILSLSPGGEVAADVLCGEKHVKGVGEKRGKCAEK